MTTQDRQIAAVTMAVKRALYQLGFATIRSGEFFGMNQKKAEEAKAA
ncbi:MAG: hypothetical protein OXH76_09990 [Boseongicola sp.]|nr:hypothetical protein [Boseongicola sp.]